MTTPALESALVKLRAMMQIAPKIDIEPIWPHEAAALLAKIKEADRLVEAAESQAADLGHTDTYLLDCAAAYRNPQPAGGVERSDESCDGTGQQPAQPLYDSLGRCINFRDVHPAQPDSGGAVKVPIEVEAEIEASLRFEDSEYQKAFAEGYIRAMAIADRRLQSVLNEARQEKADIDAAFDAFCELAREQQEHERAQLTAAQQRIADLERELENERARGIHACHDQCPRPLCVAQRRIAAITATARAQRDCKPPHTSWSPAGMHQMLVQLHDLILKEPS